MTKEKVFKVQSVLLAVGHDPGPLDGIEGPKTDAAIDAAFRHYVPASEAPGVLDDSNDEWDDDFEVEVPNFKLEEFRCKCQGQFCNGFPHKPKKDMVRIAQKIRTHFGAEAIVVSGLRCQVWNKRQGGEANSQHMYGEACDIRVKGVSGDRLLAYVKTLPGVRYTYLIPGSNNVHFDIPKGAR